MDKNYDSNKDFTSLHAWQKCQDVKLFFYKRVIPQLPIEEKYSLSNQIQRASVSITANIAEGYGRFHYQEGIRFYRISRGSIYELKDHLITCKELGYIDSALFEAGSEKIDVVDKFISQNGESSDMRKSTYEESIGWYEGITTDMFS